MKQCYHIACFVYLTGRKGIIITWMSPIAKQLKHE